MIDKDKMPVHVGIIMDGNGRWAKQRGLERTEGHKEGAKVFKKIVDYAADIGIECITFYAFSTENWKRPEKEIDAIMNLFREYLGEVFDREDENAVKGMRIKYIGSKEGLAKDIVTMIDSLEKNTADEKRITVCLAINYGGRNEILHATKEIARKALNGEIDINSLTEQDISDNLYTAGLADPDLIIRPSGEQRISNFLIWQSAYAEFRFSDILWPDFTTDDLDDAIIDYNNRSRRFGGVQAVK